MVEGWLKEEEKRHMGPMVRGIPRCTNSKDHAKWTPYPSA